MTQYENHSVLISNLLDYKGYEGQMLSIRRKIQSGIEDDVNKNTASMSPFYTLLVGSKAEGLSSLFENDVDMMLVLKDIVCKEHSTSVEHQEKHEEEHQFKLVLDHSRPGYSLLQTIYICDSLDTATLLDKAMVELAPENSYLSSDLLKNEIKTLFIEFYDQGSSNVHTETQGPSIVITEFETPSDNVVALRCECSSYLSAWISRKRNHQWPSIEVVREVSSLDSHVVPVGHTGSCFKFLEWRICFTKGEIRLVHSLNDCLTKVLILLKLIAKVTLKPLSKDMSSYLMKNVLFWLAELNDYNYFTQHTLLLALKKALAYLKHFVMTNKFPSYMIPQRNLLEGKLTHCQRIKICMRIDSLLKEGPYMVLKAAKIRTAISMYYKSPTTFSRISMKLRELHIILYLLINFSILSLPKTPCALDDILRSVWSNRIVGVLLSRFFLSVLDVSHCYKDIGEIKFYDYMTFMINNLPSPLSDILCLFLLKFLARLLPFF